jgi:hypothetical protein
MENKRAKFGNLPNYLILFIILIAASCKPSKVITVVSEKIRIDTIRDYRLEVKYNAVHDTLIIDNPCDSAGILTTFYSKITLPQGKIIIRSYKGKIQATVNIDSIRSVYEKKYRYMETSNDTVSSKIVTRITYPSWLVTAFVFESLIILGFLYFKYIFGK